MKNNKIKTLSLCLLASCANVNAADDDLQRAIDASVADLQRAAAPAPVVVPGDVPVAPAHDEVALQGVLMQSYGPLREARQAELDAQDEGLQAALVASVAAPVFAEPVEEVDVDFEVAIAASRAEAALAAVPAAHAPAPDRAAAVPVEGVDDDFEAAIAASLAEVPQAAAAPAPVPAVAVVPAQAAAAPAPVRVVAVAPAQAAAAPAPVVAAQAAVAVPAPVPAPMDPRRQAAEARAAAALRRLAEAAAAAAAIPAQ